jgi:hypothetical protein
MHLRPRAVLLALPLALALLAVAPQVSRAGIGVGVQVGPVRLKTVAHPGGSYQLTPVYVVNTGTQTESVRVRVERLSHGSGRPVPPSWVQVTGPAVQLSPSKAAQIPLKLDVPGGARPGVYLSDIVVAGSAVASAGDANLGVAAATKLEFSVGPGPVKAPGSSFGSWRWWALAALLLGVTFFGVRRSGLRLRIERNTVDHPGGPRA